MIPNIQLIQVVIAFLFVSVYIYRYIVVVPKLPHEIVANTAYVAANVTMWTTAYNGCLVHFYIQRMKGKGVEDLLWFDDSFPMHREELLTTSRNKKKKNQKK